MTSRDWRIYWKISNTRDLTPLRLLSDSFFSQLYRSIDLVKNSRNDILFHEISRNSSLAWVVSLTFKRDLMHTAWDVKRLTGTMTSVSYRKGREKGKKGWGNSEIESCRQSLHYTLDILIQTELTLYTLFSSEAKCASFWFYWNFGSTLEIHRCLPFKSLRFYCNTFKFDFALIFMCQISISLFFLL